MEASTVSSAGREASVERLGTEPPTVAEGLKGLSTDG